MAIVIGGSGAVGVATAESLFALGFDLVLMARRLAPLEDVRRRLLASATASMTTPALSMFDSSLAWSPRSASANNKVVARFVAVFFLSWTNAETQPRQVHCMTIDLGDRKQTASALSQAIALCGASLAACVLCAGQIEPTKLIRSAERDTDPLDTVHHELDVHVQAMSTVVQRCGEALAKLKSGTIVLVTSVLSLMTNFPGVSSNDSCGALGH